jgi:head-tail adaptor
MKAGAMRHWLRIERPDPGTLDGYRGEVKVWEFVAAVDAAIDSVSGREFLAADRELAGITWRITVREIPDFTIEPGWRGIELDGDTSRVFDFVAVLPSHMRDVITIAATSGQSQP